MTKNLLVLGKGDSPETDKNLVRLIKYAIEAGFDVQAVNYHELNELRPFQNETINVMPFFPYTFWNQNCEVPEDTQLYGTSRKAYERFRDFFFEVKDKLEQRLSSDHCLVFSIPLEYAATDRDKLLTLKILNEKGISTSEVLTYHTLSNLLEQATPERGIFIKCRYGAEGKGITLIKSDRWVTNYKVESGRLTNHGIYDRWNFTDITGKKELLEQLIEQEVIVEQEIIPPDFFGGKKFDVRVYVVDRKTPHFLVRVNDFGNVVTNWSQGGRVIHHPETGLTKKFIESICNEAKKASGAFHSKLGGMDVMLDRDSDVPKIIELQAFTGFPDVRKFDLAKCLVDSGFFH